MKRQFLTCWDFPNSYGCERKNYKKKKYYKRNKFDKSRGETYKKKFYKHKYKKPSRLFRKATYCPEKKRTCKYWSCGEIGHYANECKKANHKLMEALGSWDYIEIPEDEALELALTNNKGILEIIEEEIDNNEENDEYEYNEESYEEINNMMEGQSDSENEEDSGKTTIGQLKNADYAIEESDVAQMKHGSWNFPQITKDKIFKKSLFNFRIKYVYEEMEGSIVIADCENKAAEINVINHKIIRKHNEKRDL